MVYLDPEQPTLRLKELYAEITMKCGVVGLRWGCKSSSLDIRNRLRVVGLWLSIWASICPESPIPLIKEYTSNHSIKAPIRSIPYLRGIGFLGDYEVLGPLG